MPSSIWFVDLWDDDDPAVARMRDALAERPPTEALERPEAPEAAPDPTTRRERIAALAQRIEAGDLSAVATLREMLLDR